MTTRIDQAIERSSLGTKKAKAARQEVPRADAARIVAASASIDTSRTTVRGKR